MYHFVMRENCLSIENGAVALRGISVRLCLQNGKTQLLTPCGYTETTGNFSGEWGTARLELREENGVLALFAEGGLIRDRKKGLFWDNAQNNLDSHGAVSVTVEQIEGLVCYNANTLGTFWTSSDVFDRDLSRVKTNTQALICRMEQGFGYFLSVCDRQYKSMFSGSDAGLSAVLLSYKRGMTRFSSLVFLMTFGENPFALPREAVEAGLRMMHKPGAPAKERRYPELFEYLGWCSWDAFPCSVSHAGLVEKAEEFRQKGIPVRWAIIDDMWSQLDGEDNPEVMHDRRLVDFKADPKQFPEGLSAAIGELKNEYGLKVGIWHPLTGYWYGIDPDGPLAKQYADCLTETEDGRLVVAPDQAAMFAYHSAFYRYLRESGADFVKVDCQSSIDWFYKNLGTAGEMAQQIHTAVEAAAGVYFDGVIINCMGCANENIWNRPNSLVNRCSNDFLPENRKWFIDHILQCSYNCFHYSALFKGDWDMFWTDDGQAVKNCVLRAISGGPIYVSDKVSRSVAERLLPCVLADGRILRCNGSALPTADCLTENPRGSRHAFTVWNTTDNGLVMAAFNLDEEERPVEGAVTPFTLPNAGDGKYVAYNFFGRELTLLEADGKADIRFTLKDYDDFRFYNFIPVRNGFAPIGLLDKYVTSAAFTRFGEGKYRIKNGGEFAFYAEHKPTSILLDGEIVSPKFSDGYYTVSIDAVAQEHILEFVF